MKQLELELESKLLPPCLIRDEEEEMMPRAKLLAVMKNWLLQQSARKMSFFKRSFGSRLETPQRRRYEARKGDSALVFNLIHTQLGVLARVFPSCFIFSCV